MADQWQEELRDLISTWTNSGKRRNLALLSRLSSVPYQTVRNMHTMKHAVGPQSVIDVLEQICSDEEKLSFVEKHFPSYVNFARTYATQKKNRPLQTNLQFDETESENEAIEDEAQEPSHLPSVDQIETASLGRPSPAECHLIIHLLSGKSLSLERISSFLGGISTRIFTKRIETLGIGEIRNDCLVPISGDVFIKDPQIAIEIGKYIVNSITLTIPEGEMSRFNVYSVTDEVAREMWYIQDEADEKIRQLGADPANRGHLTVATLAAYSSRLV